MSCCGLESAFGQQTQWLVFNKFTSIGLNNETCLPVFCSWRDEIVNKLIYYTLLAFKPFGALKYAFHEAAFTIHNITKETSITISRLSSFSHPSFLPANTTLTRQAASEPGRQANSQPATATYTPGLIFEAHQHKHTYIYSVKALASASVSVTITVVFIVIVCICRQIK